MCKRGIFRRYYLLNPELLFSNGPEGHNEVDVNFAVYARKVKVLISLWPSGPLENKSSGFRR